VDMTSRSNLVIPFLRGKWRTGRNWRRDREIGVGETQQRGREEKEGEGKDLGGRDKIGSQVSQRPNEEKEKGFTGPWN